MDEFINEFPTDETIVTIPFIDTQMINIDDTWWDEGNVAKHIYFNNNLSEASRLMQAEMGYHYLGPHRAKLYEMIQSKNNFKANQHLFPHMVGADAFEYGSDLRATNGFETLQTVCEQLGDVNSSVWLVPNPDTKKLENAFMLAVQFSALDKKPIRSKIETLDKAGLFNDIRNHYGLD